MTNLKTRVERLESKLLMAENNQVKAIVMLTYDASKNGQSIPITKFSRAGNTDIGRHPGEAYSDFEARAIQEASNGITRERRDHKGMPVPDPIPVLIADGDIIDP